MVVLKAKKKSMTDALIKAQEVRIVRNQYENAETSIERIRLARLLEQLDKKLGPKA